MIFCERFGFMLKKRLLIIMSLILGVLLVVSAAMMLLPAQYTHRFYPVSRVRGTVNFYYEGHKLPLDERCVVARCDEDGMLTTSNHKLNDNGNFTFWNGIEGDDRFVLFFPYQYCADYILDEFEDGITVYFGTFNTDAWHVMNYDVNLDLKLENGYFYLSGNQNASFVSDGNEPVEIKSESTKKLPYDSTSLNLYCER